MPKYDKRTRIYNLKKGFSNDQGIYNAGMHLYAWYQFDQDISISGELVDLVSGRNLTPSEQPPAGSEDYTSNRPSSPTSSAPSANPPAGFPKKSTRFFNHSANTGDMIEYVDSSNPTAFSFTASSQDKPFSISTWINFQSLSEIQGIVGKYDYGNDKREWATYIHGGYLYFRASHPDNSEYFYKRVLISGTTLKTNTWHHICFTYDGTATAAGVSIYIDGALQTSTSSNTTSGYSSMSSTTTNFAIGNLYDNLEETGDYRLRADIAELAIWTTALSESNIKALERASSKCWKTISGVITNPVRTIIQENDYRTGSYPTNIRSGDRDFKGNTTAGSKFDDTKVIDFVSPFPIAKIDILEGSTRINRHWIGITSSLGDFKKDFEFVVAPADAEVAATNSGEIVFLDPPEINYTQPYTVMHSGNTFNSRPDGAARRLAIAINRFKSQLKIKASSSGRTVTLTGLIPNQGTFKQGNIITTGSVEESPTRFKLTQFSASTSEKVNFPNLLPASSRFVNQNLSTPNTAPDITAHRSIMPGISDYGIHFTPGENISAYDDSRINVEETDFYRSGTNPSVLEGFSSPLRSKTQFTFRLKSSNDLGTHIYYATGSEGLGSIHPEIAGKPGAGFAYWNSTLSKWEMLPYRHNPRNTSESEYRNALRGFTGISFSEHQAHQFFRGFSSDTRVQINEKLERLHLAGHPTNTSGFPFAQQYNATGSQCTLMSNHISSPFLLEKIRVEFKGNLGINPGTPGVATLQRAAFRNFFILAQKTDGDNPHITGSHEVRVGGASYGSTVHPSKIYKFPYKGAREIISYARMCLLQQNNHFRAASIENFQKFEKGFEKYIEFTSSDDAQHGMTGSFSFDMYPKLALSGENLSYQHMAWLPEEYDIGPSGIEMVYDSNTLGGADLLGSTGRQIATSLDAADISTTVTGTLGHGASTTANPVIKPRSEYSKISPYLLFPEDRIVFGWENIPAPTEINCDLVNANSVVDRLTDIKVTFFGSLVRSDIEYHEGSNQPLTSMGIHESLYGAAVIDQWDVEPILSLSGSTRDALFFGDMFATSQGVRGRRASIAAGQAGNSGSLNRNIQFFDKNVIYSDSKVPTFGSVLKEYSPAATSSNVDFSHIGAGIRKCLMLSNRSINTTNRLLRATNIFSKPMVLMTANPRANPFPLRTTSPTPSPSIAAPFLAFERTTPGNLLPSTPGLFRGGPIRSQGITSFQSPEIRISPDPEPPSLMDMGSKSTRLDKTIVNDDIKALNATIYSMPNVSPHKGGMFQFPLEFKGQKSTIFFRGFKYGFYNIFPSSPVYHFRRGTFGQLRDLIETPPEGKMRGLIDLADEDNGELVADQNAETSPVKVVFVSRAGDAHISPLDTNSQNLSQFATSSEPFYDGESLERDIIVSPPPDLTDRTTIEEAVEQIIDGEV